MAQPLENPIILNIMSSYGTQLIGAVFSTALWGISCMQLFLYFLNYESDHWALKAFVAYLWALDTVVEAITFVGLFPAFVTKWGSVAELVTVRPAIIHRTWLAFLLAFSVQMFFLYRIFKFTGGKGRLVRTCLIAAIVLALWPIIGIIIYTTWVLSDIEPIAVTLSQRRIVDMSLANRAASAFTDIVITTWMTILLTKHTNSTFKRSDRLLYRLVFMTINTGLWTSVVAIIDFSLIAWRSTNLAFTLCEFPLAALYLNMCLVNLNARRYLRQGGRSTHSDVEYNSSERTVRGTGGIPLKKMARGGGASGGQEDTMPIRIDTSVTMKSDTDSDSMNMPKIGHLDEM